MIGGLAIAIGLLVGYSVYIRLRNSAGGNQELTVKVVVAAGDIQVGTKLEDRDISLVAFPQSNVPPGALTRKSEALNRGVILPISKGEFILPSKLAPEHAGAGLPSMIPTGMRAVSVRVAETGFVEPGTRVDVLATGSSGNDRQTTTVLENVTVIAVGKKLDRSTAGEGPQPTSPVITLLVSPDDAQKLALVSQEGRIQLALRNPLDTKKGAAGPTKATSIYLSGLPAATDPKPKIHKVAVKVPVASPQQPYAVEVIRGSKRDEQKLSNDH
jgi:pilus assembly protein CpaB